MRPTWWMKQLSVCLVAVTMLSGVAGADPTGPGDVPQIMGGGTFFNQQQRTFTTNPLQRVTFNALYYDPAAACQDVAPTFVRLFVFNLERLFIGEFNATSSGSIENLKYRGLVLEDLELPAGTYKFTFLVRDCTNTKSVILPELLTFRVIAP